MGLQDTPRANRPHIGLFGNRNAGKSSLLNAITGQAKSLVSPVEGTTTDLVYQTFELERLGPVVFIDTAGLDDTGPLGTLRVEKTRQAVDTMDLAILVLTGPMKEELSWFQWLQEKKVPILPVLNQCDRMENVPAVQAYLSQQLGGLPVFPVSAKTGEQIPQLRQAIAQALPDDFWELTITGSLAQPGDLVLLVMPQDLQAPKGRLILPQVQTMRELLDKRCSVMSCTADCLEATLEALRIPPKLIITDSQVFPSVWKAKPAESLLTSFSILFARYKGELETMIAGVAALNKIRTGDKILICEGCTHHRQCGDIGTVKLPNWIRQFTKAEPEFTFTSGTEFPDDLTQYKLIIHCGGCMLNAKEMKYRIKCACDQNVPVTNYGMTIAYIHGVLERSLKPFPQAAALLHS